MILAFSDDYWRAPHFERRQNIIKNEVVPSGILCKLCIKLLDGRFFLGGGPSKPKRGRAENHLMIKWPSRRLLLGINAMTDRAALHKDYWMMSVLTRHRRREAKHILSFGLARDGF